MADADSPQSEAVPSETDIMLAQRRGKWIRLTIALVALAALSGGIWYALKKREQGAKAEVAKAYGSLEKCLLGGPLGDSESAGVRVRRIQLTAMAVPFDKRAKAGELAWPATCAAHAHKLAETAKEAGVGSKKGDTFVTTVESLAAKLKEQTAITADLTDAVNQAWADIREQEIVAAPGGMDTEPPPDAAEPLGVGGLQTVQPLSSRIFQLKSIQVPPFSDDTLRFLVDTREAEHGPSICSYPKGAKALTCKKVPADAAALSPGLRLWGTTEPGAEPYVFAGDRGSAGIFTSDGKVVGSRTTYGAYVQKSGEIFFLDANEEEKKIAESAVGKMGRLQQLWSMDFVNSPYYMVGVLWDEIVFVGYTKDTDALDLYVQPHFAVEGSSPQKLGPIGELSEFGEYPTISGCRSEETVVARVHTVSGEVFAFRTKGKWQPPIAAAVSGGELTCRGTEAILTTIEPGYDGRQFSPSFAQTRCTAASCKSSNVEMSKIVDDYRDMLPKDDKQVHVAEVGGKLLVVWSPSDSAGVRMKVAPLEQLGAAKMHVLYDGFLQEQTVKPLTTMFESRVITRGDVALVFLSTSKGVFVVEVDGDGKVTPLSVNW